MFAIAVGCALVVFSCSGCNGKAHSDLYQQKMAAEIRILEDQLYDADYQNRVLVDKLAQSHRQAAESSSAEPGPTLAPRLERALKDRPRRGRADDQRSDDADDRPPDDSRVDDLDSIDIDGGFDSDELELPAGRN